jgi:hypothetical protein
MHDLSTPPTAVCSQILAHGISSILSWEWTPCSLRKVHSFRGLTGVTTSLIYREIADNINSLETIMQSVPFYM